MGAFHTTRPLKIQTERNFLSSVTFLQRRQKSRLTWLQVTLLQPVGIYQGNSSGNLTRHAPASYFQTLSQMRMCGFQRKYGEEGHTSGRKVNANLELDLPPALPSPRAWNGHFSCRTEFCFYPPPAATGDPRSSSWSVPMHSTPNSRWFYIIDLILSIPVIFFFNRALSVANSVNADASLNRGIQTEPIKSHKAPFLLPRCPG